MVEHATEPFLNVGQTPNRGLCIRETIYGPTHGYGSPVQRVAKRCRDPRYHLAFILSDQVVRPQDTFVFSISFVALGVL